MLQRVLGMGPAAPGAAVTPCGCIPATVTPAPRQHSSLSGSTGPVCSLHDFSYA